MLQILTVLILAAASGGYDSPGAGHGGLAGAWRLARIDFSGLRRAVVALYVTAGISQAEAEEIADVQFRKLTPVGIASGKTMLRLEHGGRYGDNAGGSGSWAVEKGKVLVFGTGEDRYAVPFSLAEDTLELAIGKTQFLKAMGNRAFVADLTARDLYMQILPDGPVVMRLFYKRVEPSP